MSPQSWWGPHGAIEVPTGLVGSPHSEQGLPCVPGVIWDEAEDWGGCRGLGAPLCPHSSHPPVPSVFQLCHQTYKPFVFAAETLADLSM